MRDNKTQHIVSIALLTALQIALTRFAGIKTPTVSINFSFLPLVITAMLFGPIAAMVSASVTDIFGFLLNPLGPYFPGFTLSAALTGLLYGVLLYKKPRQLWRVGLVCVIDSVFISLGLGTFWLSMLFGKGFLVLLPERILQFAITAPLHVIFIWGLAYRIVFSLHGEQRDRQYEL